MSIVNLSLNFTVTVDQKHLSISDKFNFSIRFLSLVVFQLLRETFEYEESQLPTIWTLFEIENTLDPKIATLQLVDRKLNKKKVKHKKICTKIFFRP